MGEITKAVLIILAIGAAEEVIKRGINAYVKTQEMKYAKPQA